MIEHQVVTAENIEDVRENMVALDQRDELEVGCETWKFFYSGGQVGSMTIWPEHGRGMVCWGGNSDWGDWDEASGTLTLEDGQTIDRDGETLSDGEDV